MGLKNRTYRRLLVVMTACVLLGGCQSFSKTIDRLVPPWGPPEQWEPSYGKLSDDGDELPNYSAVFDETE